MGVYTFFQAFLCLLFLLQATAHNFTLDSRALSIGDVPKCGLQCLIQLVPASGCPLDDYECQCRNEDLAKGVSSCLLQKCTMSDILDTARVQAVMCNLSTEDKSHDVMLYISLNYAVAFTFVTMRFVGKLLSKRITPDDWIIVGAMLLAALPSGCIITMTKIGFGKHLWNLEHGQLKECLRLFYVAWSSYILVLGLIKVSLIMFYVQIFQYPKFRVIAYTILVYIVLSTLVIFLATIFTCTPIPSFWNRDINGKCLDINALAYANSANAIAHDVILLILPLVCIRKLNMARYRKIAVGAMFCIGTFGCITTIVRLHSLLTFKIGMDPTWDYVPVTIWTGLELGSGFVCVSLPSIRILLKMILPKRCLNFFTSIKSNSSRDQGLVENPSQKEYRRDGIWNIAERWPTEISTVHLTRTSVTSHVSGDCESLREEECERQEAKPSNYRHLCLSCGSQSDLITALPRIGCLPDQSFSRDDPHHPHRNSYDQA
ncbi:hypothetical protein BU24DRAFT_441763 [Aaosphaeria arxii CBS 175.79]|uniref:CFEM domain-containing protein n=1 Tax=Aaosphaeria arxii CBS 175.79 TaxID=1450172 RepID=A0A6A5XP33_9PLEO|nr:uncharacterized protein BU24DRAFT_441763 [Aaosphaeria arxii CBS 175.79]KAF2014114.1 hypothetical protein BU24DRAFT_441763 [Aaosphaeria arxii CBS 175.79]